MARDDATLLDIANAARLIQTCIQGMSKEAFRERHAIRPWALMAGMRDHLMHGCDAVDLDEVWKTATRDVPGVLIKLEPLLPQQPDK